MLHVQAASEDPFDALASILPSADPVKPSQPVYTGPEVKEVHYKHIVCVCVVITFQTEHVWDCADLQHGSAVSNCVCCMYHSMTSPPRRVKSVEKETAHFLQATDLKIWSVLSRLLHFMTSLDLLLNFDRVPAELFVPFDISLLQQYIPIFSLGSSSSIKLIIQK